MFKTYQYSYNWSVSSKIIVFCCYTCTKDKVHVLQSCMSSYIVKSTFIFICAIPQCNAKIISTFYHLCDIPEETFLPWILNSCALWSTLFKLDKGIKVRKCEWLNHCSHKRYELNIQSKRDLTSKWNKKSSNKDLLYYQH